MEVDPVVSQFGSGGPNTAILCSALGSGFSWLLLSGRREMLKWLTPRGLNGFTWKIVRD